MLRIIQFKANNSQTNNFDEQLINDSITCLRCDAKPRLWLPEVYKYKISKSRGKSLAEDGVAMNSLSQWTDDGTLLRKVGN